MAHAEPRRAQAFALKEEGNTLARAGRTADALAKYEKGIRLLGLLSCDLDEDDVKALEAQTPEGRELLSILASNAAQMCIDPRQRQLGKAIKLCSIALEANPANAKACFRRAAASLEHVENVAKGTDALLARAQADIRKFLQIEPGNPAAVSLQAALSRKRQALMPPIMRERPPAENERAPEWFDQVKDRAIFVCLCGSTATGRDQLDLPEALLSMALQAKDKKAISVGVAYVGYRGPDELEMFTEEWQKKYYRMLRLGERATKVPQPRQMIVQGEVYNVWSLLDGRVRVMRVGEFRKSGERVGLAWMRYCAQLLWHGEPFVYQSCRSYLRFSPSWDEHLKNDLAVLLRRSDHKPVLSWMSRGQEEEPWQWVSDHIDQEDICSVPTGVLVATHCEEATGWLAFRRRFFCHTFGLPAPVAFFSAHNCFAASDLLLEVPADPLLNSLPFNAQLTCDNVRLHSRGWDVFTPCANYTWETTHDAHVATRRLRGDVGGETAADPQVLAEQIARCSALLRADSGPPGGDAEAAEAPVPTGFFWTTLCPRDASPWDAGRDVADRFWKGSERTLSDFERQTGADLERRVLAERARNGGLNNDRDFEDALATIQAREKDMSHWRG